MCLRLFAHPHIALFVASLCLLTGIKNNHGKRASRKEFIHYNGPVDGQCELYHNTTCIMYDTKIKNLKVKYGTFVYIAENKEQSIEEETLMRVFKSYQPQYLECPTKVLKLLCRAFFPVCHNSISNGIGIEKICKSSCKKAKKHKCIAESISGDTFNGWMDRWNCDNLPKEACFHFMF